MNCLCYHIDDDDEDHIEPVLCNHLTLAWNQGTRIMAMLIQLSNMYLHKHSKYVSFIIILLILIILAASTKTPAKTTSQSKIRQSIGFGEKG